MNIFYLDERPETAARYHCDKHVVKMIVETASILSTAHHVLGEKVDFSIYKPTHKNHPSTKWATDSKNNYIWLAKLGLSLCNQYTIRYGKIHKTEDLLNKLRWNIPKSISTKHFVDPPQCMPDDCKCSNTVEAYRMYYLKHKKHFAKWKNNNIPEWWT